MSDTKRPGQKLGGIEAVTEMLNLLDKPTRDKLLANIAQKNPTIAEKIKSSLFTFEDILKLDVKAVQDLLQRVPSRKLAVAFRDTSETIKEHIYRNMPQRAAQILKEEVEVIGPQKKSDVLSAQREIADLAKTLLGD